MQKKSQDSVNTMANTDMPITVPTILTGYQYGDDNGFIGEYHFENNRDKDDIHLPPRTTLQAPPRPLPVDQEAAWDGAQWIIRNVALSWLLNRALPVVDDIMQRDDVLPDEAASGD